MFGAYKKAIPELVFDETEKLRIENEYKQKKIQELESDKKRIAVLESQMDVIKKLMDRVSSD